MCICVGSKIYYLSNKLYETCTMRMISKTFGELFLMRISCPTKTATCDIHKIAQYHATLTILKLIKITIKLHRISI